MKPQLSPDDLERLLTEETMLGASHALNFVHDVLGEEGVNRLVEWCASWSQEALGPEEGESVSTFDSRQLIAAMAAMGVGMFELGWKAHIQYGGGGG